MAKHKIELGYIFYQQSEYLENLFYKYKVTSVEQRLEEDGSVNTYFGVDAWNEEQQNWCRDYDVLYRHNVLDNQDWMMNEEEYNWKSIK